MRGTLAGMLSLSLVTAPPVLGQGQGQDCLAEVKMPEVGY